MHGREKSDLAIVAVKPTNKAGQPAAELVEPRARAKGKADQQSTHRAQNRARVFQTLERIRQDANGLPSNTRGGSRMRESRSYGSVRGASSNGRPYRELTGRTMRAVMARRCRCRLKEYMLTDRGADPTGAASGQTIGRSPAPGRARCSRSPDRRHTHRRCSRPVRQP